MATVQVGHGGRHAPLRGGRHILFHDRRTGSNQYFRGKSMAYSSYNSDRNTRFTRKSLRLKNHNYGWSGAYFITIHAAGYEMLFENPALYAILEKQWYALPERFPNLTLDEFIIMPNHVHCIVKLEGNVEKPTTLGRVMGAYKSIAAVKWLRHIEALGIAGLELSGRIWERDYYEHVIQNTRELEQKRHYIRDNPRRWKERYGTGDK